jgi:hypothetical protein
MQTNLRHSPAIGSDDETNPGLIWFTEECMNNGVPLERYVAHAEQIGDHELASFFRRALAHSRSVRRGDRRRSNRRMRGDRRRR